MIIHTCTLQIKIDGQDIREITLESLRKSIGVVPQDTVRWKYACIFRIVHWPCWILQVLKA